MPACYHRLKIMTHPDTSQTSRRNKDTFSLKLIGDLQLSVCRVFNSKINDCFFNALVDTIFQYMENYILMAENLDDKLLK